MYDALDGLDSGIIKKYLQTKVDVIFQTDNEVENNKPLVVLQDFNSRGPFQCLLCDDTPLIGQTSYDFHKHLCESHFRERLLAAIPLLQVDQTNQSLSANQNPASSEVVQVASPQRKYGCPVPNCGYELPQRWVMAKHYGLKHQIARQLYMKICDFSTSTTTTTTATANNSISDLSQIDSSAEDTLDDTFDEDSFDENEALKQIEVETKSSEGSKMILEETYQAQANDVPNANVTSTTNLNDHAKPSNVLPQYLEESNNSNFDSKSYDCKVCAMKTRGMSQYLKHLSKVHFKHKLLTQVPKSPPYKCPVEGCEVVKKDRYNISLHYGMTHKAALKLMQEMPEDALNEASEAVCKVCNQSFTAHRYLFTHLSDAHFKMELDRELPDQAPWKCPKCSYVGNDLRALRVHWGVRHKAVLQHLANQLGLNVISLKKEMKAGRKKAVSALKTPINCQFCTMQFKNQSDHSKHIVMHCRLVLAQQLPQVEPWKCPQCEFIASNQQTLVMHYGIDHHGETVQGILDSVQAGEQVNIDMSFLQPQKKSSVVNNHPPTHSSQRTPDVQASGSSASSSSESTQKDLESEKRFPQCRLCNYRYFTRLDLCRHFVDYHLRDRLQNSLHPHDARCPACTLSYEKKQSRLRHYIWSHQDLEGLVVQDSGVRLSEFMPSLRDLDIVRQKNEMRINPEVTKLDFKDITDLAALPVYDFIDVKLQNSSCELCGEEFSKSGNKARDKTLHLMGHFKEEVFKDLPSHRPFKCPKCTYVGKDHTDLGKHYALTHKVIFLAMQRELGPDHWSIGDLDQNTECKVCGQAFVTPRALTDHYCAQHFYTKIAQNLPSQAPFKCPQCSFSSKTQIALVRHMGNKHKLVTKILVEQGYQSKSASAKTTTQSHFSRRSSSASQESNFDFYQQQQNSWVEHYQYQPQQQHLQQPQQYRGPNNQGFTSPDHTMPTPMQTQQAGTSQAQPQLPQVHLQIPHVPEPPPQIFQDQFQPPPPHPEAAQFQSSEHHQLDPMHVEQQVPLEQPQSVPSTAQGQPLQLSVTQSTVQAAGSSAQAGKVTSDAKVTTRSDQTPVACPICTSTFLNGTHFLRHAADKHFLDVLKADLPAVAPFKCPYCTNFTGKDLKLLVRHYGLQHKMVLKLLNERAGN